LTDAFAPAVEIEGVSKRFGRTLALDNVSFEVRSNELIALLGPNGAGKTTLLHILCTILRPDSGTARINGADVIKNPLQATAPSRRRLPGTESRRPAHALREFELPRPRLWRSGRAA
jgi:ABC-type sugar transport system ATPase subunit